MVSKTTWVTLGAGLTAFAVSNELYVANDETVILAGFLIFATLLGRAVAKPYTEWADSTIEVGTLANTENCWDPERGACRPHQGGAEPY